MRCKGLVMVRERGLEPPRVLPHKILSLARLPVPPLPHRCIPSYWLFLAICHTSAMLPSQLNYLRLALA